MVERQPPWRQLRHGYQATAKVYLYNPGLQCEVSTLLSLFFPILAETASQIVRVRSGMTPLGALSTRFWQTREVKSLTQRTPSVLGEQGEIRL